MAYSMRGRNNQTLIETANYIVAIVKMESGRHLAKIVRKSDNQTIATRSDMNRLFILSFVGGFLNI